MFINLWKKTMSDFLALKLKKTYALKEDAEK